MLNQLFFIITVSLFDSVSTTQQIVIFVLILTTANPIKNSISYLVGLTTSYFACGMLGYMAIDKLNVFIEKFFPIHAGVSDEKYYQMQIFIGIIFAAIGVIYFIKKKNSTKPDVEHTIISRFKHMNWFIAFAIGVIISVTGFPLSLPYIAVLGKFALLKMSMPEVVSGVIVYNIFYALPMIVILFIYFFTGAAESENIGNRLKERARRINLKLTSAMFVGLGLLSIADSLVYFLSGHPMLKNRYF
jgi:cytochrome c biogenesis protein CcdA